MSLRLARRRRLLLIIRLSTDLVEWAVVVNRVDPTSQVLLLQLNQHHLQRDEAWSTSLAGTFRREEEVIERNTFAPAVATRTTTEEAKSAAEMTEEVEIEEDETGDGTIRTTKTTRITDRRTIEITARRARPATAAEMLMQTARTPKEEIPTEEEEEEGTRSSEASARPVFPVLLLQLRTDRKIEAEAMIEVVVVIRPEVASEPTIRPICRRLRSFEIASPLPSCATASTATSTCPPT